MALRNMTGAVAQDGPYTSRWEERDARRRANSELARQAAMRRGERGRSIGLVERVEKAQERLATTNTAGAIQLIQTASPTDYDYFILAEKYGQARKGVLKQFGAPRGSVERQYLAEGGGAGVGDPDSDPVDGSTQE